MAHSQKKRSLRRALVAASLASGFFASAVCDSNLAYSQQVPVSQWNLTNSEVSVQETPGGRQSIQMVVSTSREITADRAFKQVRIQNPNVITALPLTGGNRLQISAVTTGVTQVDLVGADDSVYTIEVMVLGDVRELEAILRQTFPGTHLTITPIQKGCIISGYVTSDDDVEHVVHIAEQYFPSVINKVTVTGVHTIQLETQVMEVSRTKLKELGIDWAFANGDDAIANTAGGLLNAAGSTFSGTGTQNFSIGVAENGTQFFSSIRALRQNNLVKVLANPTLTAVDGRPASFNVGGEIPIVVPSGLGQVGIQYREYGTRVDYVAKIRGEGRVYLEVRPYVSEIDPTRSVTIQGTSVPGLRSRFLETGVELQAGQTLALGGLLQMRTESINSGLPFFSDLPYLGALFRTTRELQNEIELLITVTPNFAGPMDAHEVPMGGPGTNTTTPTERELYWKGYIEVPVGENCLPGQSQPGLITNEYPSGQIIQNQGQVQPMMNSYESAPGMNSVPVPNPSALSVGPNAPKLARPSVGPTTINRPQIR
ncbi:MAG: pilus assembly protein N-terminal domain-containing protein [Pirellulaceae bacterium]|nr:pilus assembly protein N-terminal domain-containing protein [Pirellulaceae bacterium]